MLTLLAYFCSYNSLGQSQPGATVQPSSPVTQTDGANPPPAAPADAPPPQANVPEANPPVSPVLIAKVFFFRA